jgi:hypothetical protein
MLIKGKIHQEDITVANTYAPNVGVPNFIQPILLDIKGGIGPDTLIIGDFNTPVSTTDRSSRPKTKKTKTSELNCTVDQWFNSYRILQ